MTVLAVDLAAKYSAACLMDDDHTVLKEFDSWQISEDAFIYNLSSHWMFTSDHFPDVMVVEDLPHGLNYSRLVKTVCRIQGRIVQAMHDTTNGDWNDILYLAPNTWRAHYSGMERGTGANAVFQACEKLGYQPPDLLTRAKGQGGPSRAKKVASDYCSAYLIARWAIDTKKEHGTYDVPGTSRYDTDVIRKKDFDA